MKRLRMLFGALAVLGLVMSATALGQTAHASGSRTVITTHHTSYGTILVDGSGNTLYLDSHDRKGHVACTTSCLQIWPAVSTSGAPIAKGAVKAKQLGVLKRSGHLTQVTYYGHPLYTFSSDTKSTPITGEGVEGFYLVGTSGSAVKKTQAKSTPAYPGY